MVMNYKFLQKLSLFYQYNYYTTDTGYCQFSNFLCFINYDLLIFVLKAIRFILELHGIYNSNASFMIYMYYLNDEHIY